MEQIILSTLETLTSELSGLNYLLIVIFAALESIPVVGFIVPGQSILIFYGVATKIGELNFIYTVFFGALGAILGDTIAYYIGKKHGDEFLNKYGKKLGASENNISKIKNLLKEHTVKTLVLGRLHSFSRSLTAFVAGTSKVPFGKFFFSIFIGAFVWSFICVTIGYIFGSSFEIAIAILGKFIVVATLFSLLLAFLLSEAKKRSYRILRSDIVYASLNAFTLYIFAHYAIRIMKYKNPNFPDLRIMEKIGMASESFYTNLVIFITNIGDKIIMGIIFLLLIAFFTYKKNIKVASILLINFLMGGALIYVLKNVFDRPRPLDSFIIETGNSFPSGHAVIAGIFGMTLIFLTINFIKNKYLKIFAYIFVVLFMIVIPYTRLYLGVHYLSDVVAGLCLGIWIATSVFLSFRLYPPIYKLIKKEHIIDKL